MIASAQAADSNGAELAAGVATHSLDVLTSLPPTVALTFVLVGGVVILAAMAGLTAIAYWKWGRPPADPPAMIDRCDTDPSLYVEMLTTFLNANGEFAAQVGHLAKTIEELGEAVEKIEATITGCSTCPFHPNAAKQRI